MSADAIRIEDDPTHGVAVRHLVLCRPEEYNTITPTLRDELGAVLNETEADDDVKVVLIRAEGKAFCAGFGLDWSTTAQAQVDGSERLWDSVQDVRMISSFGRTFARLHEISKPTIAAVHGWCIAGGTDMILNVDLIVAADSARFGYPPARVWGVPEAPWLWVARMGLERARRYLFTGDEITGEEAARIGLVLECVADDALLSRTSELAGRMALLPLNQLQMIKWMLNDVASNMYRPETSRLLGSLFDGVARHTQEGFDFVRRAEEIGWRQAVKERDDPFGDYGSRKPQ